MAKAKTADAQENVMVHEQMLNVMTDAVRAFMAGEVKRPISSYFHKGKTDRHTGAQKISMHDKCVHQIERYKRCQQCEDTHFAAALEQCDAMFAEYDPAQVNVKVTDPEHEVS